MSDSYRGVGSYIVFADVLEDALGRLCRAGDFDASGIKRTVWLRIFDAPGTPTEAILERKEMVELIGKGFRAQNAASGSVISEASGAALLAWDHLAGQPLQTIFNKVKDEGFPVPVDNALLILEKIALALSAALAIDIDNNRLHHGFLHPGFVVVSNEGESLVSGFGVADHALDIIDDPAAREACAPYLAPEMLMARNTSKRGDVYSLGSILFQLLTGDALPPDPAARHAALAEATIAYDYEPIPDDIMALLKRCLADRPEERFSSAADFKKELDKLLYGGSYSPTTFNLALFMDRLFRSEIEAEEKNRAAEAAVDVEPFLAPEPEPEPEPVVMATGTTAAARPASGMGKWLGIGGGLALVAAAAFFFMRPSVPDGPPPVPTKTTAEIAAEKAAQDKRIDDMVQQQVAAMLAGREQEIRGEMSQSQAEIDRLNQQLTKMNQSQSSAEKQRADRLRKQILEQERKKAEQEAKLEEERKKAQEEVKANLTKKTPRPAAQVPTAKTEATNAPVAEPTATPKPAAVDPADAPPEAIVVTKNMLIDATAVDVQPEMKKSSKVKWSRAAQRSRRRGVVIVSALVNASGKVDEVKILRADDQAFGIPQAVIEAVKRYSFSPAKKDKIEVKTWKTVTVPYNFK